jgi:hypothetical protein
MVPSSSSPRVTELVESSAARLSVLLGALRTLQVPDPRLSPLVLNGILSSAVRQASELETLIDLLRQESANAGGAR